MADVTYIIVGILIALLGAYFGIGRPLLQSKLTAEQLTKLAAFAKIAVQAAEQIIELVTGKDKKAWAMDLVKKMLAKAHLTFDEDIISAAIEDKVYEMNKEKEKVGDANE